ncbi:hypothetical protein FJ692_17920 [Pseudomonas fluorescens]|nr:hypothetical protein C1751_21540 [Pseudomonas fluorescens]TPV55604.1 hypothetical protein FJ692_17920 [Pseudomonas fluorescens]
MAGTGGVPRSLGKPVAGHRRRQLSDHSRAPLIVPTLRVGMQPVTLCVTRTDAERPAKRSHAGAFERVIKS